MHLENKRRTTLKKSETALIDEILMHKEVIMKANLTATALPEGM